MLKLFGAVLTVAAGGFLGIRASSRLKVRYRSLSDYYMFLGEISDKIRVGIPLIDILKDEKARRLCVCEGYLFKPCEEGLTKEDNELLSEFFSGLGMSDTAAGVSRCENYRELIKNKVDDAGRDVSEKARLYSLLGLFFGIFIAIILI